MTITSFKKLCCKFSRLNACSSTVNILSTSNVILFMKKTIISTPHTPVWWIFWCHCRSSSSFLDPRLRCVGPPQTPASQGCPWQHWSHQRSPWSRCSSVYWAWTPWLYRLSTCNRKQKQYIGFKSHFIMLSCFL